MISYSIKFNTAGADQFLKELRGRTKEASVLILSRTGAKIVANTQQNYLSGQVLKVQSGRLRNSGYWRLEGKTRLKIGFAVIYAAIHEFGGTIVPRSKNYLKFQINGRWVMTKKVVMPKRPYLSRAIAGFFDSGDAQRLGESTIQQLLKGI